MILEVKIKEAGYDLGKSMIKEIQFTVEEGELIGLIGPNGAGKSTTIKSILGMVKYVQGQIDFGSDKKSYAYVPEQPVYYEELTLWDHLEFAAQLSQMEFQAFTDRAEQLLTLFHLTEHKYHFPSSFSKGMQQKLMLILALLSKPDLYIVDEPFVGLDPKAIKTFLRLLEEERARGAGIIMSTHVLDTAEKICDRFLLVSAGRIAAQGTLAEIREASGLAEGSLMDYFEVIVERELHAIY